MNAEELADDLRARAEAHGGDALLIAAAEELERLFADLHAMLGVQQELQQQIREMAERQR